LFTEQHTVVVYSEILIDIKYEFSYTYPLSGVKVKVSKERLKID